MTAVAPPPAHAPAVTHAATPARVGPHGGSDFAAIVDALPRAVAKATPGGPAEQSQTPEDARKKAPPEAQPQNDTVLKGGSSLIFAAAPLSAAKAILQESDGAARLASAPTTTAQTEGDVAAGAAPVAAPVARLVAERTFLPSAIYTGASPALFPTYGPAAQPPPSSQAAGAQNNFAGAVERRAGPPGASPAQAPAGSAASGPDASPEVLPGGSGEALSLAASAVASEGATLPDIRLAQANASNPAASRALSAQKPDVAARSANPTARTPATADSATATRKPTGAAAAVHSAGPTASSRSDGERWAPASGEPSDNRRPSGDNAGASSVPLAPGSTAPAPAASLQTVSVQTVSLQTASAAQGPEASLRVRAPAASSAPVASPVKEIELDLAPGGLDNVSMTMRLAGERLSVVIRAGSAQTAGAIEGARDAIAARLAAIGQPLGSLVIQQTGSADAAANAKESDGGGGMRGQEGQHDTRGDRRGASRGF